MRLSRTAAVLTMLLLSGGAAHAAYGLRDIVTEALQRNPDLRAAGADVDAAAGRALAAEGVDDFVLDASGSARFDETALVAGNPFQNPSSRLLSFQLQLTKPLPWGGSLGLRASTNIPRNKFATVNEAGMTELSTSTSYAPGVSLVWQQPLLRGAGFTAARGELKRARVERDAARLAREATAATVLRDVATAYWQLRFAVEVLEVNRQLAAAARDQLKIVEANIKAGKMPSSASAEVVVAAGLRDEQVLLSERDVLERSLQLRTLAGMPIGAGQTTVDAGDPLDSATAVEDESLAAALDKAQTSPALLAARAAGTAASIEVDVTENGLLPQLDLSFLAGTTGSAEEAQDAFEQLGKFDTYTVQAALTFRHPIGRRAARGQTLAARAALRRANVQTDAIAAQTTEAVVRLHALTDEARRRLDVIAPTSEAASVDLAAERARFEVGRASNFDVLRRQDELAQTRLRQARARTDLLTARAALWAATGEILARFGVTVH